MCLREGQEQLRTSQQPCQIGGNNWLHVEHSLNAQLAEHIGQQTFYPWLVPSNGTTTLER